MVFNQQTLVTSRVLQIQDQLGALGEHQNMGQVNYSDAEGANVLSHSEQNKIILLMNLNLS